jgi:hypothetical protein
MNNQTSILRAIRGPITMIVVGVLFLIDHLGYYSFRQTWPVLLIVMGVLTLAARSGAFNDVGRPGPGAGPEGGVS